MNPMTLLPINQDQHQVWTSDTIHLHSPYLAESPHFPHSNHPLLKCSQLNGPSLQSVSSPEAGWCFWHPPSRSVSTIEHQGSFLPPVKYSCSSVSALNSHSTALAQAPPEPFRLPLTASPSLLFLGRILLYIPGWP